VALVFFTLSEKRTETNNLMDIITDILKNILSKIFADLRKKTTDRQKLNYFYLCRFKQKNNRSTKIELFLSLPICFVTICEG